jgi:hypothetical protein
MLQIMGFSIEQGSAGSRINEPGRFSSAVLSGTLIAAMLMTNNPGSLEWGQSRAGGFLCEMA